MLIGQRCTAWMQTPPNKDPKMHWALRNWLAQFWREAHLSLFLMHALEKWLHRKWLSEVAVWSHRLPWAEYTWIGLACESLVVKVIDLVSMYMSVTSANVRIKSMYQVSC
jgi:hypothetical protein